MTPSEQAGAPQAPDSQPIAPPLSVEERVGNFFADEPDQAPEAPAATSEPAEAAAPEQDAAPEAEPTAPEFEEVEYDGEKYQVPPKLKEAIIRHSDYTKKTQEVAQQRKALEHVQSQMKLAQMQQQLDAAIAPELQQLSMVEAVLKQKAAVDWQSMSTDEIVRTRIELDQFKEHKAALEQQIEAKRHQTLTQQREELTKLQQQSLDLLKQRIPSWNEDTAKATREWALSQGFTAEELSSIYDPRHAEVLYKAAQFDAMKAKAAPAVQQVKAIKPTPSSNPMPPEVKAKLNFRKALAKAPVGSPERKAAVEERIAAMFGR